MPGCFITPIHVAICREILRRKPRGLRGFLSVLGRCLKDSLSGIH